ncbi:Pectinesterase, catalytic [Corchorus olitorius]|uniref:Pectinesterase, catalytic n=1 Tax=Corchorus olitorius TaxID=93759 RepID=A0A1R3JZA5_9ROSI|nr:Pectinesterase, catalytic [Corchorus olitorius]
MAVAFLSGANESVTYNCIFISYQGAFYTNGRTQFYRDCDIYGIVDFIFGKGRAVFQNRNLFAHLPNRTITFTAQSKSSSRQISSYVFQNCSFTLSPEFRSQEKGLGRAWIGPVGSDCCGFTELEEFNNEGPSSNTSGRVSWSKVLPDAAATQQFTVTK